MDVLTPEEVKRLLAACRGDRLEAAYVLGAPCGLRVGECLSLRYEDIDFERGTLNVRRTLWRNWVYPTKTQRSHKTIKLPRIALDALRRQTAKTTGTEGWLFPSSGGNPVDATNFFRWGWKPMLRKASLPETTRYHDLRHTAASIMLGQNVPLHVVSYVLGYANPNITATIYAHMLENMSGRGADGMDDALR